MAALATFPYRYHLFAWYTATLLLPTILLVPPAVYTTRLVPAIVSLHTTLASEAYFSSSITVRDNTLPLSYRTDTALFPAPHHTPTALHHLSPTLPYFANRYLRPLPSSTVSLNF